MTSLQTVHLSTGRDVLARVLRHPSGAAAPRCVLVHGNPGTAADWDRLLEPLARVAHVAAFDLPGFGASLRPGLQPALLDLEHLAADVLALADALGFAGPLFLVGHSHGGAVAQVAASAHPERVQGIVLLGSLGLTQTLSYRLLSMPGSRRVARAVVELAGWRALRRSHGQLLGHILARIFHPEPVPQQRLELELTRLTERPEILLSMFDVAQGHPTRTLAGNVQSLRCPALVVHGERDALVPLRHAERLHAAFSSAGVRSTFVPLPGAGHQLQHFQAEVIAQLICRFWAAQS